MGKDTRVDRGPVPTDQRLRSLLRAGRHAAGKLSQKAAARAAGISPVYWQRIESGNLPSAPASTLAAMFLAAGVPAGRLRDEGYDQVAAALDELTSMKAAEVSPEDYLAATPGASAEEITALQALWKVMRAGRTPEPLEQDFTRHARKNSPDTAKS
jgi:transcriptional regulator with XRE-family HTH domain